MNKKLVVQIENCFNCPFCKWDKNKPGCIYPTIMLNGMPIPLTRKEAEGIPNDCPLVDATDNDNIPAPILYEIDEHGNSTLFIRN